MIFQTTLLSGAAYLSLLTTLLSLFALLALHVKSSELAPSRRMVSEYANGPYAWLLTTVFMAWALSSFALTVALSPLAATWLGLLGLGFLVLAGIGEFMGGLFDINHKLHGAAFGVGVPSLAMASILLTLAGRRVGLDLPLWAAAMPLLSVLLMAASMVMLFASFKANGVEMVDGVESLDGLPESVTAWNGWANRILFIAYYGWVVIAARAVLKAAQ